MQQQLAISNKTITTTAGPSLALIKYWGKQPQGLNIPSCTSIAITLDTLQSTARITQNLQTKENSFLLNGKETSLDYLLPIIQALKIKRNEGRKHKNTAMPPFLLEADNNFPTGAGLASSASGIAACTVALARYYAIECNNKELSQLARLGSGSACRSIFGGFTQWQQGSDHATQLASCSHWDNLRMIVLIISNKKKSISSRQAMLQCAKQSVYYPAWVRYNNTLAKVALTAIQNKDIESLGTCMRQSYNAMHATMLAMNPPLLYWQAASVQAIHLAETLRSDKIQVWETMDAGPQVKYLTEEQHVPAILSAIETHMPQCKYIVCKVGKGVQEL